MYLKSASISGLFNDFRISPEEMFLTGMGGLVGWGCGQGPYRPPPPLGVTKQ